MHTKPSMQRAMFMMESAEQMPRLTQTVHLLVSGKRDGDGRAGYQGGVETEWR